uniref:Uncharacterized protein n=1 Tax=Erpetoichthys calabaricus TaxID=27687 RepID=A0A8C4XEA9_ERPCA
KSSRKRVFKVVFIGNSGVGKTSFIHYFCQGQFLTDVCSTVGIDYQMRSLIVDNVCVVLQLWDTAGQERFLSITKHPCRQIHRQTHPPCTTYKLEG